MFRRFQFVVALGLALTFGRAATAAVSFTEDFSNNPLALHSNWSFGIGDNSNNQFVWTNLPPAYAGDVTGALKVHLDSSLPTARFQRPLGVTLTDTNSFTVSVIFSFTVTSAPADQDMQIALGLVNSSTTGGNRTGSPGVYTDDNTFDTVEFNYFANGNPWDPTLTPAVFGARKPDLDAFGNSAALYYYPSELGVHTNGITALPTNVMLQAVINYDGATKTITLTMGRVNPDGSVTTLDTELPALNIAITNSLVSYDTNFPFRVDSLAIMAYNDGFTSPDDPSLIADLTFQRFSFWSPGLQPPNPVMTSVVGTNVLLSFATISNLYYDVQSTTNLASGAWSTIASNIPGTGGIVTNVDVGAAVNPAQYYRVGLVIP